MLTIADIFKRELWSMEFINESSELTNILNSSVVTSDPDIDRMVQAVDSGTIVKVPYVQEDLYSESVVMDDSANAITVGSITKKQADAFVGYYAKSWGQKDIIKNVGSGLDGIDAAQSLVGRYWAKDIQAKMVQELIGAKASNVANESGDNVLVDKANKFSYSLAVDTLAKAGDNMDNFAAVIVHSLTKAEILKNDAGSVTTILDSELGIERTMYNGLELIVNDAMPTVVDAVDGDRITTFFLRKGAFVFSQANVHNPIVLDTDEKDGNGAGSTALISRNGFLLTLNGYTYTATTQAGVSPTNAELADATNWTRLVDAKQAPFVALESLK